MPAVPAAGTPDRIVLDLTLVLGAVGGIMGVVLTFVATVRQGRPNRRGHSRRRQPWPADARRRIAELEREVAVERADGDAWRTRWEQCDGERLQLLRERRTT